MRLILFVAFLAAIPAIADQLPSAPHEALAVASVVPHTTTSVAPYSTTATSPLTGEERERLCGG